MGNYLEIKRIQNLLEEYKISDRLKEMTAQIQINNTYDILPQQTRDGIQNLKNSELSTFDSDRFLDNVSEIRCRLK